MNTVNLIWRNSIRKKTRFILTLLSIAIAFFLYTAYSGINYALTSSISESNQFRLISNHKVSITRGLPINYQQKMQRIEGVAQVSYASWFGAYFKDEKNQITVMAVDSESYFKAHPEYVIGSGTLSRWQNDPTGLLIGQKLAEKYGWHVGDQIPISTSIWMDREGSFTWYFNVIGIFRGESAAVNENQAFFHHAYFDEGRLFGRYAANWFIPVIQPNTSADVISKRIDNFFENAPEATRTTTEQVFIKEQTQQFVDMAMILKLVVAAVFFTLLLIVCNTMMQIVRERRNETAIMKAIGFSRRFLISLVFYESLLVLALGTLIGSAMAYILLGQLQQMFADFLPGIALSHELPMELALMVVTGAVICSVPPALSIFKGHIISDLGAQS